MKQVDFYTGEPVQSGSPQNSQISSDKEQEMIAAEMASFGKYDYDPSTRQNTIYPGGYGYNQPRGIGANPYMTMSPYGNPQPTYGMYKPPYYQGPWQPQPYNPWQQQIQQMPEVYHIPGINWSGEYLPPSDYDQRINDLQMMYWEKSQDREVKQSVQIRNSVYGYGSPFGYNYYNTPYYNNYQYNTINQEIMKDVDQLKEEARENRMQLNLQLSQLAHNFARDGISQEAIEERYRGVDKKIPQGIVPTPQEFYAQQKFMNLVPFNNADYYRAHYAQVSAEFNEIISPDSNLKDTFSNMGVLYAKWEMEDELHRRRNAAGLYNSGDNAYKYFVRKKAQERYQAKEGISPNQPMVNGFSFNAQQARQQYVMNNPILSQNATLSEDGTLNVTCNFGSHAGQTYSVHNSNEAEYAEKRERFGRFVDSIPGSIYLDTVKAEKKENYDAR